MNSTVCSVDCLITEDFIEGVEAIIEAKKADGQSDNTIIESICSFGTFLGMDIKSVWELISATKSHSMLYELSDDVIAESEKACEAADKDFEDIIRDINGNNDKNDGYSEKSDISRLGSFGLYLKDIANIPIMSRKEELKYAEMAASSDRRAQTKGRQKLVESHLRLVVSMAKKRHPYTTLELEDLVGSGNLGLQIAAEKFDYSRGYKFSTFAYNWIRQCMTRAINEQSRTIRIPSNKIAEINQVGKFKAAYRSTHGEDPTTIEIANHFNKSVSYIENLFAISSDTSSLDEVIDDDGKTTLGSTLQDDSPDPLAEVLKNDFSEQLDILLQSLPPLEYHVFKEKLGLNCVCAPVKDIAEKYNISEDDVKKIVGVVMRKLRAPCRREALSKLLPYLQDIA